MSLPYSEYDSRSNCNSASGYVTDRVGGVDLQFERTTGTSNALSVNGPNGLVRVGGSRRKRRRRRGGSVAGVISGAIVPAALLAMQNQLGRKNVYSKKNVKYGRRSRRMR
jgi:hypothetical protein